MADLMQPGDVFARHIGADGRRQFIRIGWPLIDRPDSVYVQDCDGAGFLLNGKGRWLLKSSVASRYRLHYRPEAR
jgi:hypothetical protein